MLRICLSGRPKRSKTAGTLNGTKALSKNIFQPLDDENNLVRGKTPGCPE
jgi:hypothetical protein